MIKYSDLKKQIQVLHVKPVGLYIKRQKGLYFFVFKANEISYFVYYE